MRKYQLLNLAQNLWKKATTNIELLNIYILIYHIIKII